MDVWRIPAEVRYPFGENYPVAPREGWAESENRRKGVEVIYFIRSGQFVKIGYCARDPIRRLEKLQIGNPMKLKLLALRDGSAADERALHERFSEFRVRGEWFRLSAAIREAIAGDAVDHKEVSRARPERKIYGRPVEEIYGYIAAVARGEIDDPLFNAGLSNANR